MAKRAAPVKRKAEKRTVKRRARKIHTPLSRSVLVKAATAATRAASKRAFEHVDSLLVAQDGWLVRIDREGCVLEKVKRLDQAGPITADDLR